MPIHIRLSHLSSRNSLIELEAALTVAAKVADGGFEPLACSQSSASRDSAEASEIAPKRAPDRALPCNLQEKQRYY